MSQASSRGAQETSRSLAEALEQAGAKGWEDLRIVAECASDRRLLTVEIFDNGVGLWNEEKQFDLSQEEVADLLDAFREADFAGMRESYGGKRDPKEANHQPLRVTCRVILSLDGITKQVVQLHGGRQSDALKRLATRILETCRKPAASGVGADDLGDGLTKIARGELAAEALQVLVHRKAEAEPSRENGESWLLRVEGRTASTRRYTSKQGYEEPIVLDISQEDLAKLLLLMDEQRIGDLPTNMYAEHYTDIVVKVLNREKRIQARQFAGMTADTHGDNQDRFDQIYEAFRQLHRRVLQPPSP